MCVGRNLLRIRSGEVQVGHCCSFTCITRLFLTIGRLCQGPRFDSILVAHALAAERASPIVHMCSVFTDPTQVVLAPRALSRDYSP